MNDTHIQNVIEAALLAAGRSLPVTEIASLFDEHSRPDVAKLREVLATLQANYEGRGIEVRETGAGFRIQVRKEFAAEVSRLWPERPQKYSRAMLETLALIAYRQPVTRAEIEAVRGVAVNPNIVKTLLERSWIRVVGHRDLPGHPELLGTTRDFLDYFGLKSLDELPPLAQLKSLAELDPQLELPGSGPAPRLEAPDDGTADDGADEEGTDDEELSAAPEASAAGLVAGPAQRDHD
jgi:segregation and condensation protein B